MSRFHPWFDAITKPVFQSFDDVDRWLKLNAPEEWAELQRIEAEQRAAENATKYLDPYNEAVSLFLEYEMGYVDAPQPTVEKRR
jgi:hypothetical protein